MKPRSISIVPAFQGFFTVVEFFDTKEIVIDKPIIAWRIETREMSGEYPEFFSQCMPLTVHGDIASDCIGIKNPDNTITIFIDESTYSSLQELQESRRS